MIDLPEKFIAIMKAWLGGGYESFAAEYKKSAHKAIRVNTLKISVQDFIELSPFALTPVPWEERGFYVDEEKAGKTPLHAAGLYYVQEPSAMSAAPLLNVRPGERVLDMCSAPGGKGTQLAQDMRGQGVLILNEVNFTRAKILSRNVERLGVTNAAVICAPPEKLAARFEGCFDKVLVDAPCSGEGMFRKEPNAIKEWSAENVSACAIRQTAILESAQRCLKPGGLMVYSTCTFSVEEDELQIENFLKTHKNFELITQKKLMPHEIRGEGHFVALLKKLDGESGHTQPFKPACDKKTASLFAEFEKTYLKDSAFSRLHLAGDTLYSIMPDCPELPFRTLRAGVRLCELKSGRIEPSHSLAMCLKKEQVQSIEVDERLALAYLSGNAFRCDEGIKGWATVNYLGYPLGWCKAVEGVAKNHLPKGIRI